MNKNKSIILIGIAGRTGSGKTYLTNKLIDKYGNKLIDKIEVDAYYKDLSHLPMNKRAINNFDHPNAFDFKLLISDLNNLKNNKNIEIPVYNYCEHIRTNKKRNINHTVKIIILEGIYALFNKEILKLLDYKVFIDISQKICIEQRIDRDVKTRDRTIADIKKQINKTVIPMFNKFVLPTKLNADIIIKNIDDENHEYIKLILIINQYIHLL